MNIDVLVLFWPPFNRPEGVDYWIGYVVALTVALIVVCALKGEKPRWRWGGDE